jgi:hypothetical protein
MRRRFAIVTSCAIVLTVVTAAVVVGQEPARTITITLAPRSVSVAGADNLPAGPTRIQFRSLRREETEGLVIALRPGRTVEDLRRAIARARRGPGPVKAVATIEASGAPARGATYTTTIDLRLGATYVAGYIVDDPENRRMGARLAAFTVGTTTAAASRPVPAATVGLYDYAYAMPGTLPRRGVIRFENRGERIHMAVAFPLRRGTSRAAAVQALLRNRQRRFFGRLVNQRRASEPLGPVSSGTVNDVEVEFGRRSNWVFVCFIGDGERGNPQHFKLGMVKAFTVR